MLLLVHYPQDFTLDKSDLTPFSGPYFVFLQSRLMFVNNQRCLLFPRKKKKDLLPINLEKSKNQYKLFFSTCCCTKAMVLLPIKRIPDAVCCLEGYDPMGS